jgi:hypothetical protein
MRVNQYGHPFRTDGGARWDRAVGLVERMLLADGSDIQ